MYYQANVVKYQPTDNIINGVYITMAELVDIKEQAQKIIDEIGIKVSYLSEEAAQKVIAWKSTLDTETRREVRNQWIWISCVAFLVGLAIGWFML